MHFGHLLTRAARRYPDRTAWLQGGKSIPFREAEDRVNRLANALVGLGGRRGDRVGMLLPNCYQGLETLLAPMKAGMAVVPMNARLHSREHQILLQSSEPFALVYGEEFREHLAEIRGSLDSIKHFICVGDDPGEDLSFEALLESASPAVPDAKIEPDDLAWLFYTSGTTGRSKGAMLTHRVLVAMVSNFLTDLNPAEQDDVILHGAPITHASGLSSFHHITRGAACAFPDTRSFDPPKIFEAIQRYRVTTMFMAPTMINMLLASEEKKEYDLSSLHTVLYGGGPMYTEHLLEALDTFGNIFVQLYGLGEAPMTITSLRKEEHQTNGDPLRLGRLASAGREVTGVRVEVVDREDKAVATGDSGEVLVRSDIVMKGYFNNPEATAETLRGGWLHTGDIGHLDSEGYLFITDRKNDMIISGGANVYPREVEEVISRHPSVAEVAVIGVPDSKWGEAVKAMAVLQAGMEATAEEIIEFCRDNLASYKKPQSVDFIASLPKNAYGKVEKKELRAPFWVGRERKI